MDVRFSKTVGVDATRALQEVLAKSGNEPMLFLASGGSALSLLDVPVSPTRAHSLTISVLDEHYVSDARERNFTKLSETLLFRSAVQNGATVLDLYGGTVEKAGARFNAMLTAWRQAHPAGKIVYTAGIGADGHTAGIIPLPGDSKKFAELFENPNRLAVGFREDENSVPERVTATFTLLRVCAHGILYATGAEKEHIVREFLAGHRPLHTFPALFFRTLPNVTFFTDCDTRQ